MNKYIRTENCEETELDGEWIILNTNQFTITKLNDVGGHCWSLLIEAQTASSLTKSLVDNFSTNENRTRIRNDIEEFLTKLLQLRLIQHVD